MERRSGNRDILGAVLARRLPALVFAALAARSSAVAPTVPGDSAGRVEAALLADAGPLVLGALLVAVGLLALAAGALRRRRGELFVVAFGAFSLLYGLRLLAETATLELLLDASPAVMWRLRVGITYVLPVPAFLAFEQFLGPGWRSSLRRVWQVFVVVAVAAFAADAITGVTGVAIPAASALVIAGVAVTIANLFRRDLLAVPGMRIVLVGFVVFGVVAINANLEGLGLVPWRLDLEPVGFLFLVGCLGWAAARRFFANERQLASIEQELETARRIQASILPDRMPEVPGLRLAARYLPMSSVAGDFYDFLAVEERRLGVLVADVSGHGVPAALIASMVKVAVAAQNARAADPAAVLAGMNRIFLGKLKRQFVTAAYLFVDLERQTVTHASGGHPPPLLWRRSAAAVEELPGRGPLLGRFADARFECATRRVEPGDRIVLYTDGVVEAAGRGGEPYGEDRFRRSIAAHAGLAPERHADALLADLARFTRGRRDESRDDDLTLVLLELVAPAVKKEALADV